MTQEFCSDHDRCHNEDGCDMCARDATIENLRADLFIDASREDASDLREQLEELQAERKWLRNQRLQAAVADGFRAERDEALALLKRATTALYLPDSTKAHRNWLAERDALLERLKG
jgi:hypothetical protein